MCVYISIYIYTYVYVCIYIYIYAYIYIYVCVSVYVYQLPYLTSMYLLSILCMYVYTHIYMLPSRPTFCVLDMSLNALSSFLSSHLLQHCIRKVSWANVPGHILPTYVDAANHMWRNWPHRCMNTESTWAGGKKQYTAHFVYQICSWMPCLPSYLLTYCTIASGKYLGRMPLDTSCPHM